jgi:hypothetical protein
MKFFALWQVMSPADAAACGWTFAVLGAIGSVGGILFALPQSNLKRLLAFSSVENMGIVAMGLGLSFLFDETGSVPLATLCRAGALVHILKDLDEIIEAPKVNSCLRLIKHRELCAAGIDHSDLNSLELTARERSVDLAVNVILSAKSDLGKIRASLGNAGLLACRKRDQILNRDALESYGLLKREADARICTFCDREIGNVDAIHINSAARGGIYTRDELCKRRLSASVGARNCHEAIVDLKIYVFQYRLVANDKRYVLEL